MNKQLELSLFAASTESEVDKEKPHSVCPKCGCKHVKTTATSTTYCKPCRLSHNRVVRAIQKDNPRPDREDYCCNICGKQERDLSTHFGKHGLKKSVWRLDHDHSTGKFRGYLCDNCNVAVGKLDDDPETILKALWYVKTNNGNAILSDEDLVEWCYNILSSSN